MWHSKLENPFRGSKKKFRKRKRGEKIKPSAGKQIDLIIEKNEINIFEKEKIKNTKPENSQHPPPKKNIRIKYREKTSTLWSGLFSEG